MNDIVVDFEKIKLENEENGLKYIIVKGIINILNEKERMIILSNKNKQLVNEIFDGEGEPKDFKEGKFDKSNSYKDANNHNNNPYEYQNHNDSQNPHRNRNHNDGQYPYDYINYNNGQYPNNNDS